jgi:hypothetical protein
MRLRSLLIPVLLCLAAAAVPGLATGQTGESGTAATPTETTPAVAPAEGQPATTPVEQPPAEQPAAQPPAQPAVPPTGTGTTGAAVEGWGPAPAQPAAQAEGWGPAPAQPAAQAEGWGPAPAQPAQPAAAQGWGETPAQPDTTGWGAPAAEGWGEQPSFELPEDQQLNYWPLLFSLGAGIGGTFEGTVRNHMSAVTLQPSVFVGFLKHFGFHHGPFLSIPIGLPGTYSKTVNGDTIDVSYGVSAGIVPGYQILHLFRRDMFWGVGIGYPMLIAQQQGSARDEYTFIPGIIEINAEFGYKFLAGLGVFVKATFQAYQGTYTQLTFGAEAGLCLYYDWFRPWEAPAAAQPEQEDQP